MESWGELNFILLIYTNASQLTCSLIGPPALAKRVLWIMFVLLSGIFTGMSSFVFSGTQHGIRGPYGVMTELDFWKNYFFSQKWGKLAKPGVLWMYMKILLLFFFSIWSIIEVYINFCMLGKIFENFGSWDMCQNLLGQSDYRIFKSTTSLEQNDEVWFFTCWYSFIEIKSWLKNIGMGVVINGFVHSEI